jgi:hypothetical protein
VAENDRFNESENFRAAVALQTPSTNLLFVQNQYQKGAAKFKLLHRRS